MIHISCEINHRRRTSLLIKLDKLIFSNCAMLRFKMFTVYNTWYQSRQSQLTSFLSEYIAFLYSQIHKLCKKWNIFLFFEGDAFESCILSYFWFMVVEFCSSDLVDIQYIDFFKFGIWEWIYFFDLYSWRLSCEGKSTIMMSRIFDTSNQTTKFPYSFCGSFSYIFLHL